MQTTLITKPLSLFRSLLPKNSKAYNTIESQKIHLIKAGGFWVCFLIASVWEFGKVISCPTEDLIFSSGFAPRYTFIIAHAVIIAQKMKFSIKDSFIKCEQIRTDLVTFTGEIHSGKNFSFCAGHIL